ncbi:hypothetical protein [Streptomyces sp. NPDC002232]|uniref:hypothetical protein n=1 Tax=Streptomyces sp. NPDC002232 TaxID=3364640 RepID=UPI0036BB4509
MPLFYQPLRRQVDLRESADARLCFYLSALFTAAEEIQGHLAAGTPVVVESYFARCLANHHAFGARLGVTLPPDLPQPTTYHLLCAEDERQRRLSQRVKPTSWWDALSEEASDRISSAYAEFPMHRINTTGSAPEQVVQTILTATQEGQHRADAEPVGAHPHVLPPVPRRPEGAHVS